MNRDMCSEFVTIIAFAFSMAATAMGASAQTFDGTGLKVGDSVEITTDAKVVRGKFRGISQKTIVVDRLSLPLDQLVKVEVVGDPIWNGTLMGAAVGAVAGAVVSRGGCASGATAGCIAKPSLVFGALAAWMDFMRIRRSTVYPPSKKTVEVIPTFHAVPGRTTYGLSFRYGRRIR